MMKIIDEELAILRAHVAEVHLQIATHCRMRNQLSPIHKLPPEVLSNILQMATTSERKATIQLRNQLSLERVCSHWRRLMDAVPRIFSGASRLRNERVVSASGDLPLHVIVSHYNGGFLDFSERYIHRWRSLRIDEFAPEAWLKRFHRAAPLLQSVEVKVGIYKKRWPGKLNPFDGKAPQLRHLKMLYAPLQWNSSLIHGLQSLHVMLDLDPETDVPYELKLCHILQNCPLLEEIVFSGPYSQRYDPSLIPQRSKGIIKLPHLRKLMLWSMEQFHVVRWLLNNIRAPSLEVFKIGAHFIDVAELTATFEALPVDGILSMPSNTLHMILGESVGSWIEVKSESEGNGGQVGLLVGCDIRVRDTSTYEGSPIDFVATILPFWTHLIRKLELHDGYGYKFPAHYGNTIRGFLVELVGLENLIVKHGTMKTSSIITVLGSPIVGKDSGLLLWPCPKLTCLELDGKGWLHLVEVLNSVRTRYGVLGHHGTVQGHCALPVRLKKLVIALDSRCPESINTDYNSAMTELTKLVGDNVINLVGAETLS
ncbi:hypothetical protein FRC02_001998 [Tulasnella sp. 418]|nr:hypothetical protein FRC02_001998 [Tulasnella sp. 418]